MIIIIMIVIIIIMIIIIMMVIIIIIIIVIIIIIAKRQLSCCRIGNGKYILKVHPEGGGANRSTWIKNPTACPLIGITY